MSEFYTSVHLDKDLCKGCINCIKRCPTEAIRVRNGKAVITKEYCIDCGECIRICKNHAKLATTDSMENIQNYKYYMVNLQIDLKIVNITDYTLKTNNNYIKLDICGRDHFR